MHHFLLPCFLHLKFIMSFLIPVPKGHQILAPVEKAAQLIKQGHVIALPTDTVYGLAGAAQNSRAVKQLYNIKGRDLLKPLAICVDKVESIAHWGGTEGLPSDLLDSLLPGPVTVVLERTPSLNPELNPDNSKVGIRIPDNEFVLRLCERLGTPLALTSANFSNAPSSLAPEEFQSLWPHLAAVFSSGRIGDSTNTRAGSTVVDLSVPGKYCILRPGSALTRTKTILEQFSFTESYLNCVNGSAD